MQSHPTHSLEVGPEGPPPGATSQGPRIASRRNRLATLGVPAAGSALAMDADHPDLARAPRLWQRRAGDTKHEVGTAES